MQLGRDEDEDMPTAEISNAPRVTPDAQRVADELRDGLLQRLTALGIRISFIRSAVEKDQRIDAEAELSDIAAQLDLELDALRRVIDELKAFDDPGDPPAWR